jgi:hypothetical protein
MWAMISRYKLSPIMFLSLVPPALECFGAVGALASCGLLNVLFMYGTTHFRKCRKGRKADTQHKRHAMAGAHGNKANTVVGLV